MSTPLFRNTYSGLITKGLGGPAGCGLITLGFGVFVCSVTVTPIIPPPVPVIPGFGGGGGFVGNGSIATHPNIYAPYTGNARKERRHVTVSIKFNEKSVWRTQYNLSLQRANLVVRVVNITNVAARWINISVDNIKRASRSVIARFK